MVPYHEYDDGARSHPAPELAAHRHIGFLLFGHGVDAERSGLGMAEWLVTPPLRFTVRIVI